MRILKLAAVGVLALGASAYAGLTTVKTGLSAQTSLLNDDAYHAGMGVNGFVASERGSDRGAGGLGLRANFDSYQAQPGFTNKDIQEGGVAVTAMGGPNSRYIQPRLGGHVGYARQEGNNYLDVGPDVQAALMMTPRVGLNALVTPTWFINGDKTDYLGTKMGLGVTWAVPGA